MNQMMKKKKKEERRIKRKKKENEEDIKIKKMNEEIKKHFEGEFSKKEYKYYEKLFNKNKNKIKKNEDEELKYIDKIFTDRMEKKIYEYIESYNNNYLSFERKIQEILKIQEGNITIYKKEKIKNALKNYSKFR